MCACPFPLWFIIFDILTIMVVVCGCCPTNWCDCCPTGWPTDRATCEIQKIQRFPEVSREFWSVLEFSEDSLEVSGCFQRFPEASGWLGGFLRVPEGSRVSQWFSDDFPIVSSWFHNGVFAVIFSFVLWLSNVFFQWISDVFPMVLQWFYNSFPMVSRRFPHGFPWVAHPWRHDSLPLLHLRCIRWVWAATQWTHDSMS